MSPIQRQYSLPNCTLSLEGFSDRPKTSATESRPLITMLMNAECRLAGQADVLKGGRDFLESLVRATSLYAQVVLSGVQASQLLSREQVQLQKVGLNRHQLLFKNPEAPTGEASQAFTLSSVQLFDLIEAIDQLLSDPQTLPDLSRTLAPISRQHIQSKRPIADQVVPAAVGMASLAVAAIALSMLPTPEIQRPDDKLANSANPTASKTPNPAKPALISDAGQLEPLQKKLFKTIDENWKVGVPSEPVVYRLTVDGDARVMGYVPQSDLAREELDKTPLVDILKLAKTGGSLSPAAIAAFEVTFNPNGRIDLRPWQKSVTPVVSATPSASAIATPTPAASAIPTPAASSSATPTPTASP